MFGYSFLKKERSYSWIFWSSILNGVGARFAQVGSFALLYLLTESAMALGLLMALRVLPTIFFAPLSGYFADKVHKAKLLFWTDACRIPFALLPVGAAMTGELWLLYASTFVIASGESIYRPVRFAIIPDIVQRKHLTEVNGLEQTAVGLTLVFGSLLGGVIAFLLDVSILFFVHALFLFLATLCISPLTKVAIQSEKQVGGRNFSLRENIALLSQVALLRVFLLLMILMPLANGVDNVIFNLIALDVFEKGDLGVGIIYSALGLGFVLSSLLTNWIGGHYLTIGVGMIFLEGVGHLLLSQSFFFSHAVLFAIVITFVGGVSNICFDTVLMRILPATRRGLLFGTLSMIQNSSMGVAMIGAGFLTEWLSPMQSAFWVGITYLLFALLFLMLFKQVNKRKSIVELKRAE